MATPISASTSYCTPAQMLSRYDWRKIAEYCSDEGVRIDYATLLTNTRLQDALDDASGVVESAAFAGQAYKVDELSALTGTGAKLLQRLIADIAIGFLLQRRVWVDRGPFKPSEWAQGYLDQLKDGRKVFGLQAQADAGLTTTHALTADEYVEMNLATYRASRLFGGHPLRNT